MNQVNVIDVEARPTLVVAATTTWCEFAALWPILSGEVWECLRAADIRSGARNVMLYLDDTPRVEVGVAIGRPCPLRGRVVTSHLPAGRVATATHRGSYAGLADAHVTVLDWCRANGLQTAGPRWEVYGPHRDDPAEVSTKIYWLLV